MRERMLNQELEILKEKAARFCAYRDRCTFETRQRLRQYGASSGMCEKIIDWLIDEQYLDDSRFATIFARSKFNSNQWGKLRIRAELQKRQIARHDIQQALELIDQQAYLQSLQKLAQRKYQELQRQDPGKATLKTAAFLIGKGFEPELVWASLKDKPRQESQEDESPFA